MYIAHVLHFNKNTPKETETLTFTCKDHAVDELVTLLVRYQRLINELNDTSDMVFQLINVFDIGRSYTIDFPLSLGAIELSRDILRDLKDQKRKKLYANSSILSLQTKPELPSEEEMSEGDKIWRAFNLPKLNSANEIHTLNLHPVVKDLVGSQQLWAALNEEADPVWYLLGGKIGSSTYTNGEFSGPCFLIQDGSTYYLSASSDNPNEGN